MSASPRTMPGASPPAQAADAGGGAPADPAGRLLRQLTVLPTLLAMAWLLTGLPLLLLGAFTPVLMLVISAPLAALLVALGLRWMPGRPAALLTGLGQGPARTPWWTVAALLAVAVAFGVDQAVYHSQQIIVQRDPASYIQFANWLARHGSLPIPQDAAAFGGTHGVLSFYSPAFHPVGHSIVPQFMAGLPMTLAAGFWAGGVGAAVAAGTLLGACGVLALGGLVARLVGPRWAPLGALILALALPEQFTSRSTYSEPLAQVLFLGGLCLIIDSFGVLSSSPDGAARRGLAALGGLAAGLTLLVRIDGASDMLPLIPYCGLLLLGRRRQALPLIGGVTAGAAYGVIDGVFLSRPYLGSISSASPGRSSSSPERPWRRDGAGACPRCGETGCPMRRRRWRSPSRRAWSSGRICRSCTASEPHQMSGSWPAISALITCPSTRAVSTTRSACTGCSGTSACLPSCSPRSALPSWPASASRVARRPGRCP
jgi:hypothetical protein